MARKSRQRRRRWPISGFNVGLWRVEHGVERLELDNQVRVVGSGRHELGGREANGDLVTPHRRRTEDRARMVAPSRLVAHPHVSPGLVRVRVCGASGVCAAWAT